MLAAIEAAGLVMDHRAHLYRCFPGNSFTGETCRYFEEAGVRAFRCCVDTGHGFFNCYRRVGGIDLLPSCCGIPATLSSLSEVSDRPGFFCRRQEHFSEAVGNQRVVFVHGRNFADGELGFAILRHVDSYFDATGVVHYGKPCELRDSFLFPAPVDALIREQDGVSVHFEEPVQSRYIQLPRPSRSVSNEEGQEMAFYSGRAVKVRGQRIRVAYGQPPVGTPRLVSVSPFAYVDFAVVEGDGLLFRAHLEGSGSTPCALGFENLAPGVKYGSMVRETQGAGAYSGGG